MDGTNAYTAEDHTAYTAVAAGEEGLLRLTPLFLEHIFNPELPLSALYTEVYHKEEDGDGGVIYCEVKGTEESEEDRQSIALHSLLFPHSPYSRNCGGYSRLLKNVDIAKLKEFHAKFYRPECATLVFTGGYNEEKVLAAVEAARCFHGTFTERASCGSEDSFPDKSKTPLAELLQSVVPLSRSATQSVPFLAEDEAVGSVRIGYPLPYFPLNQCSDLGRINTIVNATNASGIVAGKDSNADDTTQRQLQLGENKTSNPNAQRMQNENRNESASEKDRLYDSALQAHGVFLLSKYLEESASSPLRARFVEREHPLCSDLAVDIMPFLYNVIEVSFDGVPMDQDEFDDSDCDDDNVAGESTEGEEEEKEASKMSTKKQKSSLGSDKLKGAHLRRQLHSLFRHLLDEKVFGKGAAPSAVMAKVAEQARMRLIEAFEDQPHDVIDERVTADCLFVDHNDEAQCSCIGESLSFNKYLDYLARQPPSYWESLLCKCFISNHYAEVITVPQLDAMPLSVHPDGKERSKQQQQQLTNKDSREGQAIKPESELTAEEWERLLGAAVQEHEREMPKPLADLVPPLPDINAIPLHRLCVRVDPSNGLRGYALHDIEAETLLYSYRLFFDIRALPARLRPLLLLFQEMVLTSDVSIDDPECVELIEKWRDQKRESEGKKKRKRRQRKAPVSPEGCGCGDRVLSTCDRPALCRDECTVAPSSDGSVSESSVKGDALDAALPASKSCPVSSKSRQAASSSQGCGSHAASISLSHSELATFLNDVFATAECSVGFGNAGFGCVTMPHLISLWLVGDESAARLAVRLLHAILSGAHFTTKRLETVRASLSGSLCESLREPDCVCTAIESIVLGAAEAVESSHSNDSANEDGNSTGKSSDCRLGEQAAVREQHTKGGIRTSTETRDKGTQGKGDTVSCAAGAEVSASASENVVGLLQPLAGEKSVTLTLSQSLSGAVQRMVLELPLPQAVHGLDEIRRYLLSDAVPLCLQRVTPRRTASCESSTGCLSGRVASSEVGLDPFVRCPSQLHPSASALAVPIVPTSKRSCAAPSLVAAAPETKTEGKSDSPRQSKNAAPPAGSAHAVPRFTFAAPRRGALRPRAVLCGVAGVEVGVLSLHTPCAVKRGTREGRAVACLCEILSRSGGPLTAAVRGAGAAYGASVYHNESAGVLTFAADRCRDAAETITRFRGVLEDVVAHPDAYCSPVQLACAVSTLVLAAAQRRGTVTCTAAEGFRSFSDGDADYQQTIDVRSVPVEDIMEAYRTYFTGFLRRDGSATLCCVVDSRCAKREAQRLSDVLGTAVQPRSIGALCGRRERLELFAGERKHKKSKGKSKGAGGKDSHGKERQKTKGKKK